jgi:hypothetical protein
MTLAYFATGINNITELGLGTNWYKTFFVVNDAAKNEADFVTWKSFWQSLLFPIMARNVPNKMGVL